MAAERDDAMGRRRRRVALAVGAILLTGCGQSVEEEDVRASTGNHEQEGYVPRPDGVRLYFRVIGSGPDTVVAVHGGPGAGMGTIRPALEPLARRMTVVLYDQRGGGRSSLPADTSLLDARYFVEDLEAVRRHFELESMKLFAHSFGAIIAARYAVRYPDHLDRMVFHAATAPSKDVAVSLARAAPESPDPALARRYGEQTLELMRGEAADPLATCHRRDSLAQEIAEARGETPTWNGTECDAPAHAIRYYFRYTAQLAPRSFGEWDFTTGMKDVAAPLLVIPGARDSLALRSQQAWADAVPHGRLLLIDGRGDALLTDRPEGAATALARFLRGEWPEAAVAPQGR